MPQISKGDTFANNQQLTAARLNQLVDAATITVNVITDQTPIASNTLEATDTTIVSDSGVFKKAAISDFVGSGIPVISPSVTSTANKDITITPFDGVSVVGSNYISTDGITVTVTTIAAHELSVNQVITISGAGTGYNGTFKITEVTTYTFKYVLFVAATTLTPVATACTYIREGTAKIAGQAVVSDNLFVSGNVNAPVIQSTSVATTNVTSDTATIKTTNVTTALQISGTPVWGLVSITDTTIPFFQCNGTTASGISTTCNQWVTFLTLSGLTKTNKEQWIVEADFPCNQYTLYSARFRITVGSTGAVYAMQFNYIQNYSNFLLNQIKMSALITEGTVLTSDSIKIEVFYNCSVVGPSNVCNIGYGGGLVDPTVTSRVRTTKYIKP